MSDDKYLDAHNNKHWPESIVTADMPADYVASNGHEYVLKNKIR